MNVIAFVGTTKTDGSSTSVLIVAAVILLLLGGNWIRRIRRGRKKDCCQ